MGRLRVTVSVIALVCFGLGGTAIAAKAKKPPPPPPPPVWSWTGFYVGGNVGYSWGSSSASFAFSDSIGPLFTAAGTIKNIDGIIGGGQVGYNWQNGNWVYGLEADFQGSGERGTGTFICPAGSCSALAVTATATEKLNWFGTVRPRLGWTITPETMIYATGGLAYGEVAQSGNISNGATATTYTISRTSAGWTAGGGFESHLRDNWTWKVEYLFLELEEPTSSSSIVTGIPCPFVFRGVACGTVKTVIDPLFQDNIIRVGLNYKWN